jgi:hypothetical protein
MKLNTYTVKLCKSERTATGGLQSPGPDITLVVPGRNRRAACMAARTYLEAEALVSHLPRDFALTFRSVTRHGDPRPWLQLNGGSSPRGADMGRFSFLPIDRAAPVRFHLRRMPLSQGYDQGGAYWGNGAPMFRAIAAEVVPCPASYLSRDESRLDRPQWFTRARSRAEAKALLLAEMPGAKFFR